MAFSSKYFFLFPLTLALLTGGCAKVTGLFDGEDEKPLPGERISVLELQKSLEPDDTALAAQGFVTPAAWRNEFWPQAGGYPNHSMQNLDLSTNVLKLLWSTDIGEGSTKKLPLTSQPVIIDGRVFTLDTQSSLAAFNAKTGQEIWRANIRAKGEDDDVIGGGVAFSNGTLFATSGYNEVLAVQPSDGKILWRKKIPAPSRAAPTIMDNRIFVTTLDNRLLALNTSDGTILWEYAGMSESASLVGAASPAASQALVVPVFSSGEISALRVENGSVAWSDNLSNIRAPGGLASLSDIRALPVMDKGMVIAVSFSGRLAAIDERTGTRIWQREIASSNTPWMAGNHLFVLSSDNQLIALGRDNGTIRWVTKLPRYENPDKKKGNILWTGPLFAGGRLFAFSNTGQVVEADPENGNLLRQWDLGHKVSLAPVVAGGILYVLGDNGTLAAYK